VHHLSFIFIAGFYSCATTATEFKINEFLKYGSSPSLELSLVSTGGSSAKDIFDVLNFSQTEYTIRLIGISSEKTNSELLKFYELKFPNELKAALNSSGNLHNPAIKPLSNKYELALKSTSMLKELEVELYTRGFLIKKIDFEKFHMFRGTISIADTYVYVARMPNKKFNKD